jgi:hypothetical protein
MTSFNRNFYSFVCSLFVSGMLANVVGAAPLVGGVSYNDDLPAAPLEKMSAKLDVSAPKQDCICFNNKRVELQQVNGSWKLVDNNNNWILDFAENQEEGKQAISMIQNYKLNNICFAGRPFPNHELGGRLMYFLSDGQAPEGPRLDGEDSLSFENARVKAEQIRGSWKVTCGDSWMLDFGSDQSAAQNAADIIKFHGFQRQCFIGRPGPSMMYFVK